MKDYYATLGVAETASATDIKKAYRRLAKEYHPDATGGDRKKESRFKDVSEAYSVLSDTEKRSQYDQLRKNPFAQGAEWGGDTGVDIGDIFAQFFGGMGGGRGGRPRRNGGGGRVEFHEFQMGEEPFLGGIFGGARRGRRRRSEPQQLALLDLDLKEAALGTVKTVSVFGKTMQVRIPSGVHDGARLRAGDVSFQIRVLPHPELRREGADIHSDLTIGFDEAMLGAKVDVPTLDGRVALTIPPGTSSGATLRLRG